MKTINGLSTYHGENDLATLLGTSFDKPIHPAGWGFPIDVFTLPNMSS